MCAKHLQVVVSQDSLAKSQSWLAAINSTIPLLIMCMYVGSDVSLAEYLCTHVFLITVAEENVAPSEGFYVELDVDE